MSSHQVKNLPSYLFNEVRGQMFFKKIDQLLQLDLNIHFQLKFRSTSNALRKSNGLFPSILKNWSKSLRRFCGISAYSELSGVLLSRAFRTVDPFMPLARRSLLLCDIMIVLIFAAMFAE